MRLRLKKSRFIPAALCLAVATLAFMVPAVPARAQDPAKYHNYADLSSALQALAGAHKDVARLTSIGKSIGGRDIWALEIANPAGVPLKDRPALLIAANFEADHLIGSEIALVTAETLLKGYPANGEIKAWLDSSVIYVIPRMNPDGAEGMFAPVKVGRKTNLAPRDDDNDGRIDEDGPEDLNKDGFITLMRVKASDGEYIIDPEEPRLMRKADPKKGESGVYKIFWEGVDRDKDGFIAEDGPGGADLNRNFMHEYPYYKPDAGPYMVSEKESQALMAWVVEHKNVAAILTFGESDNLIAPPAGGRPGSSREIDMARFAEASLAGSRTTGMIQSGGAGGFGRFFGGDFSFEMMGEFMRGQRTQTPTQEGGRFRMPDRKAPTAVLPADQDYFRTISQKYGELVGIRQPLYVREPQGAFYQYGYFQFGVPSFSTPGFGLTTAENPFPRRGGPGGAADSAQAGGQGGPPGQGGQQGRPTQGGGQQQVTAGPPGAQGGREEIMRLMQGGGAAGPGADAAGQAAPGIDKQILKWMEAEKIDGFVMWTKFTHPDLGEVEIGGFKPYAATNPPAAKIAELGASHAKFALYLASLFAKVKIAKFEATSFGGGVFRLRAEVENTGFLPTALAQAVSARAFRPTMIQLQVKPEAVIAGNVKTNYVQTLAGSGNAPVKYEWVIKGKTGDVVELRMISEKGGRDSAKVTLK